jgi:hypothetical protein
MAIINSQGWHSARVPPHLATDQARHAVLLLSNSELYANLVKVIRRRSSNRTITGV